MATRIDGGKATNNQDRQETNSPLAAIRATSGSARQTFRRNVTLILRLASAVITTSKLTL